MILLSFDTEEFDVPREHGVDFPLDEAMKVSVYGTNRILDCLKNNGVKATFFCTSNFAENAPEVMRRLWTKDMKLLRMDVTIAATGFGCQSFKRNSGTSYRQDDTRLSPAAYVPRIRYGT